VRLLGLAAAGLAFAAQPVVAQQPNRSGTCVLHVAGTVPPPPMRPNAFIRVQGPVEDPNDPSTRAYQYNPITRALGLSDSELRTLLPSATDVAIVRHPEGLARDRDKRARAPLYPRNGQCHAELIVSDVVGVFGEEARPLGLLQALLVGGNRLEAIFTFRRFDGSEGRPAIVSSREDGRLPAPVSSGSGAAAITAAMAAATSEAFSDFAGNVARRARQ
jgi:hypothetical protein